MKNGENPTHFVKTLRKFAAAIFSAQESHLSGLAVIHALKVAYSQKDDFAIKPNLVG